MNYKLVAGCSRGGGGGFTTSKPHYAYASVRLRLSTPPHQYAYASVHLRLSTPTPWHKRCISQRVVVIWKPFWLLVTTMKPLPCPVCLQSFSRKNDLKRHRTTVHENTQYPCHCGKPFNRQDNWLRHQTTCPKRLDSQSQLGAYTRSRPTSKTSTTPSSPELETMEEVYMIPQDDMNRLVQF